MKLSAASPYLKLETENFPRTRGLKFLFEVIGCFEKKVCVRKELWIPQTVAGTMLLWVLYPENPYGYYVLLRWIVCPCFIYAAWQALRRGKKSWVWILGVTAAIYNPVIPLHLSRELWNVLNLIGIAVGGWSVFVLKIESKYEGSKLLITEQLLRDNGLKAEQATKLLTTRTETQAINDIEKSFSIPRDEAAGVVAVIQSLGLDVNDFVFTKDNRVTTFKGRTQFIPAMAKALVTAGSNAGTETAVHEVAHVARRLLLARGMEGSVDEGLISYIEKEYGVGEKWSRKQEEVFAEDFVAYIRAGNAPAASTEALFTMMSNWIRQVPRLFSAKNRTVPENMEVLFGKLMKRGQLSEENLRSLDGQVAQMDEKREKNKWHCVQQEEETQKHAQQNEDKRRTLEPEIKKRLRRSLASAAAGILLVMAIIEAMAVTHDDNTKWIRTHEEMIPAGDNIVVSGPDWGAVIMLIAASGITFWLSVDRSKIE